MNNHVLTLALPSLLIAVLLWALLASSQVWINGQHADGNHAHHHTANDHSRYDEYTNSLAPVLAQSILPILIVAPLEGSMSYFEISPGDMLALVSKQLITILFAVATFGTLFRLQNTPFSGIQPLK